MGNDFSIDTNKVRATAKAIKADTDKLRPETDTWLSRIERLGWLILLYRGYMELNYFASQTAARQYAAARPYFHPLVIAKIRSFLNLQEPLPNVLDVGCGTGQSSIALKNIASTIIGTDSSQDMLNEAPRDPCIRYLCTLAEQIPLPDASFDLITVASAFHWFDRSRFLAEAQRLLLPVRWLVLYNNSFYGTMKENPAFEYWCQNTYISRYPTPARNSQPLTENEALQHHFHLLGQELYTNDVIFLPEELTSYLMSQSNVIASIEQGRERSEDAYAWLLNEVSSFFQASNETFRFGGTIEYWQKE